MNSSMVTVDLTLDLIDSEGKPSNPIIVTYSRLMALRLKAGEPGLWYGFIVSEALVSEIVPGCTARVKLAFLDNDGAMAAFPNNASVLFGDGVASQGVLVIREKS